MTALPEALDQLEAALVGDLTRTSRSDLLAAALRLDQVCKRVVELYLQRETGLGCLEQRWDRRDEWSALSG